MIAIVQEAMAISKCVWGYMGYGVHVHGPFQKWSVSSQVKSIHKQQTTIRKRIECAPEASRGGRERAEMAEGD